VASEQESAVSESAGRDTPRLVSCTGPSILKKQTWKGLDWDQRVKKLAISITCAIRTKQMVVR